MATKALTGLPESSLSSLWQASENYLNHSKDTMKVVSVCDKTIVVTPASHKIPLILTILKIVSYMTILLPVLALIIRSCFRKRFTVEVQSIPSKPASRAKVDLDPDPNAKPFDESAYSLNDVINKIKTASTQGLKTALFVGRDDTMVLPKESGWYWISLDITMQHAFSDKRPHLRMNMNYMFEIARLFNKVVVDSSVIKFFEDSPWDALHNLLKKSKDSELVVETSGGTTSLDTTSQNAIYPPGMPTYSYPLSALTKFYAEERRVFAEWKNRVGAKASDTRYKAFLASMTAAEIEEAYRMSNGNEDGLKLEFMRKVIKEENLKPYDTRFEYEAVYLEKTKAYLENLFEKVAFHDGEYPYPVRDWNGTGKIEHWVCQSPK